MKRRRIILVNKRGEYVYPQASLDNLILSVNTPTPVVVPYLDAGGKIGDSYIPDTVARLGSDGKLPIELLPSELGSAISAIDGKQDKISIGDGVNLVDGVLSVSPEIARVDDMVEYVTSQVIEVKEDIQSSVVLPATELSRLAGTGALTPVRILVVKADNKVYGDVLYLDIRR